MGALKLTRLGQSPAARRRLAAARPGATACAAAVAAAIAGSLVALHYHRLGLTLSHYDARGHLVVARRIVDSITPGWQQIGATWLPLPHLLNLVPVQVDAFYRSGASAVAISIAAFAVATGAIAWTVCALTGSAAAGLAGSVVFALNPNVLYLQATPLTEPLLLALTIAGIAALMEWCQSSRCAPLAGATLALACLTRYEAWPVAGAAVALAAWARWRSGEAPAVTARRLGRIGVWPAVAVAAFLVFSRIVVGQWFVSSGFFVPENKALGDPMLAAAEILWGTRMLSGQVTMTIAAAGLIGILVAALARRERSAAIVVLSVLAMMLVPWAAFVNGHPFRIRYMVPLAGVEGLGAGAIAGLFKPARVLVAALVIAAAAYELHPLDASAPMVIEAQWDRPNLSVRQSVTDCLRREYTGDKIMASMASLGHYLQETARDGFLLRDFLHEGNGDVWLAALDGPRPFVGWVLIEEKANGGDMLAKITRQNPHFLDGFTRVCEGAGLALYKRSGK
jgi:hypothetical protein